MASTNVLEASSTESYEEAARKLAEQMKEPNTSDQLIEFTISALRYREGGIVGFPPTYIVEAEGSGGGGGAYE